MIWIVLAVMSCFFLAVVLYSGRKIEEYDMMERQVQENETPAPYKVPSQRERE